MRRSSVLSEGPVISRRVFLGSALATPLASATFAQDNTKLTDTDLHFGWNEEKTVLSITAIRSPLPGQKTNAYATPPPPVTWKLRRESFGPKADFILRRHAPASGETLRYELRVVGVTFGRLSGRGFSLFFALKPFLESGQKEFDGRMRFRVFAHTRLFSSMNSVSSAFGFNLGRLATDVVSDDTDPFVLFEQLATESADLKNEASLGQIITCGQITNTFGLMFNGQIGFSERNKFSVIELRFHHTGQWSVTVPEASPHTIHLMALHEDIQLKRVFFDWVRPKAEAGVDPLWSGLQMRARGDTTLAASGQKDLQFGGGGIRPVLRLHNETPATVVLRATTLDVSDDRPKPAFRSEAGLLLRGAELGLLGSPTETVAGLKNLNLRLVERVDAPAIYAAGDAQSRNGSLVIDGASADETHVPRPVESPIGRIEMSVLPLDRPSGDAEDTAPDATAKAVFAARDVRPVSVVLTWTGARAPAKARTEWAEVHGLLTRAELALPDAGFSRLSFEPTDLTILYSRRPLETEPLGNVLLLGAAEGQVRARIDLARATLRATRPHDMLSLWFRFQDLHLLCRGTALELVSLNRQCLETVASGARAVSGGSAAAPDPAPLRRPTLVVEFPPQHMLEEAKAVRTDPVPPDVNVSGQWTVKKDTGELLPEDETKSVPEKGYRTFELSSRIEIVEMLSWLPGEAQRSVARQAIRGIKSGSEADPSGEFKAFANELWYMLHSQISSANLPSDQTFYIGPFAMDPDAMAIARHLARNKALKKRNEIVDSMLEDVRRQAAALALAADTRIKAGGSDPQDLSMSQEWELQENAWSLEDRLESAVPGYAALRSMYRDTALRDMLQGKAPPAEAMELLWRAVPPVQPPNWSAQNPLWTELVSRAQKALNAYKKSLVTEQAKDLSEGRLSGRTRLAYRLKCRDGLVAARLAVPGLDHDPNLLDRNGEPVEEIARPGLARARFAFSLAALTNFADMELAVIRRAERVFAPNAAGRTDADSARRISQNAGAMLDHLGFRSGEFLTSSERLADVQSSLVPPGPFETAIEIPARLVLSTHQEARFLTPRPVPQGVYGEVTGPVPLPSDPPVRTARLWSADLFALDADPGLRAVYSPDLVPGFVWSRLHGDRPLANANGTWRLPGGAPPLRGPWAPWTIGREEGFAPIPKATDLVDDSSDPRLKALKGEASDDDAAFCAKVAETEGETSRKLFLPTLIDYLCGRPRASDFDKRRFRAPLDAYARHELVVLTSAWGLPVAGRRNPDGTIPTSSSQVEPDRIDSPIDLAPGSALYVPRTLNVRELSLTALGGSFRHDTVLEPPAGARLLTGGALFDALSVEKWQQWTVLGRDILCEVVYKGFLFPFGHRASLVQLTERTFFEDMSTRRPRAIRAYLNQRLFIRVGKPDKEFPAVGQPLGGRMFPPRKVSILTTETPDLVDPFDDVPGNEQKAGAELLRGRLFMDQAPGLAFWPRTAPGAAGDVRFEVALDGVPTKLPMIFVDNTLANDETALAQVIAAYNEIAAKTEGNGAPRSDRRATLDFGGRKLRYADEREQGSASIETVSWTLTASGQESEKPTVLAAASGKLETLRLTNQGLIFDPVLQGADQPPFYPVLFEASVNLNQTKRLTGQEMTGIPARLDATYLRDGLPAISDDTAQDRTAEVFLALYYPSDKPKQTANKTGDRMGGIVQPDAVPAALSRSRGLLTWRTVQSETRALDTWDFMSALFEIQPNPSPAVAATAATPPAASVGATVETDQSLTVRSNYAEVAAGALNDAKLLGTVKIADILKVLKKVQGSKALGDAVPLLTELVHYGAEQLELRDLVATLRARVIIPLSEVVAETRRDWEDFAREISETQKAQLGTAAAEEFAVKLEEILPELDQALRGLDAALKASAAESDPITFGLTLGALHQAGRRFVDALRRTAANPLERFEAAIRGRIQLADSLFSRMREQALAAFLVEVRAQWKDAQDQIIEIIVNALTPENGLHFRLIGLDEEPVETPIYDLEKAINKALGELDWEKDEVEVLVRAAATYLVTNTSAGTLPKDPLQGFLGSQFPASSATVPKQTVAEHLRDTVRAKLKAAETALQGFADAKVDRIKAEIGDFLQALDREADRLIDWFASRFWREWLFIQAALSAESRLRAAVADDRYLDAVRLAVDFLEDFSGRLDLDITDGCKTLLSPVVMVLGTADLGDLALVPLGSFPDFPKEKPEKDPIDYAPKADEATVPRSLVELFNATLSAGKDIAKVKADVEKAAESLSELPPKLTTSIEAVQRDIKAAETSVEKIGEAAWQLLDLLRQDALEGRTLQERIRKAGKAVDDLCKPGARLDPKVLRLDQDVHASLRRRAVLMKQIEEQAKAITEALVALSGNRTLIQAAVLAALVAAADDEGLKDLKDWATETNESVKKWKENTEGLMVSHAVRLLHPLCHGLGQFLATAVTTTQDLLKSYEGQVRPYIDIPGLSENAAALAASAKGLDTALKGLDKLATKVPKDIAGTPPFDPALTYAALGDALRQATGWQPDNFKPISEVKPNADNLSELLQKDIWIAAELEKLERLSRDLANAAIDRAVGFLGSAVKKALELKLTLENSVVTLAELYAQVAEARDKLAKDAETQTAGLLKTATLFVPADPIRLAIRIPGDPAPDALAIDVAALSQLTGNLSDPHYRAYVATFLREWSRGDPTPVRIADQLLDLAQAVIRGEILQLIDLNKLRARIEERLLALIPVEVELRYQFGITLEDQEVTKMTGGLFRPVGNPRLELASTVRAAIRREAAVTFAAEGRMGSFEIKLVGDLFDALTLRFGSARFTAGTGQKARFDIDYLGHKVGPALAFVEKLSAILNPGQGSGPYIRPLAAEPGIEAGYRLCIGAFSLGAVAFANVNLDCGVMLPFSNTDARFTAALSSPADPFTISYLPWGGSGSFRIEATALGIVRFEASFSFGGAAIFAFGPLTGTGRLMSGLQIRSVQAGGRRITEIYLTFFVGGSAKIWIFSFGASLSVKLGMVNGDMIGEAVFTYSFSVGILDYEFSIKIVKKENQGYEGNSGNGSVKGASLPLRFAELGPKFGKPKKVYADGANAERKTDDNPHIKTTTQCQGADWAAYSQYFSKTEPAEGYF